MSGSESDPVQRGTRTRRHAAMPVIQSAPAKLANRFDQSVAQLLQHPQLVRIARPRRARYEVRFFLGVARAPSRRVWSRCENYSL